MKPVEQFPPYLCDAATALPSEHRDLTRQQVSAQAVSEPRTQPPTLPLHLVVNRCLEVRLNTIRTWTLHKQKNQLLEKYTHLRRAVFYFCRGQVLSQAEKQRCFKGKQAPRMMGTREGESQWRWKKKWGVGGG